MRIMITMTKVKCDCDRCSEFETEAEALAAYRESIEYALDYQRYQQELRKMQQGHHKK